MEEYINNFLARKFRKQGKDYRLSDNSKRSGQDFGYANRMASKIYKYVEGPILGFNDRVIFQRLASLIISMLRKDEQNELGQLRLGNGNVGQAEGFRLLEQKQWRNLFPWFPTIVCDLSDQSVKIQVAPITDWPVDFYEPNVKEVHLKLYVVVLPFETTEPSTCSYSKTIDLIPGEPFEGRLTKLSFKGWENCLLFVFGSVRCALQHKGTSEIFVSSNQKLMASDILKVFRLKDGALLEDRELDKPTPNIEPQDDGADWV